MALPPSPLPFRAAIMESQGQEISYGAIAPKPWDLVVAKFNCSNATSALSCMQAVDAKELVNYISTQSITFEPIHNNLTWTYDIRPMLFSKTFANVPFMIGSNSDEGRVIIAGLLESLPNMTIASGLNRMLPNNSTCQQEVRDLHANLLNDTYLFLSQVLTDLGFTCSVSLLSDYASQLGYSVWRYYYSASYPDEGFWPEQGAYHAAEIPQVWGTYESLNSVAAPTESQRELSRYMQTAWADFAKNPGNGPGWPKVGSLNLKTLGVLGGSKKPGGVEVVDKWDVDYVCPKYAAFTLTEPL